MLPKWSFASNTSRYNGRNTGWLVPIFCLLAWFCPVILLLPPAHHVSLKMLIFHLCLYVGILPHQQAGREQSFFRVGDMVAQLKKDISEGSATKGIASTEPLLSAGVAKTGGKRAVSSSELPTEEAACRLARCLLDCGYILVHSAE